jgi:hypothetical protein
MNKPSLHQDARIYIPKERLDMLTAYEQYVTMNTHLERGMFKNLAKKIGGNNHVV